MRVAEGDVAQRLADPSIEDEVWEDAQPAQSHCFGRSDGRDPKPGSKP